MTSRINPMSKRNGSGILFLWDAIGPLKGRALWVVSVMVLDSILASLGIGLILPVFQALMSPNQTNLFSTLLMDIPPHQRIGWLAAGTAIVFLVKGAVSLISVAQTREFAERLRVDWIGRIGERYLLGPCGDTLREKQGQLLNDWFNEPGAASRCFLSYASYASSMILVTALLVLALLVDWRVVAGFVVFAGGLLWLVRKQLFGGAIRHSQIKLRLNQGMTALMAESLTSLRDLKLLAVEPVWLERLHGLSLQLKATFIRTAVIGEMPRVLGESVAVAALMGVIFAAIVMAGMDPQRVLPLLAFFIVTFYRLITAGTLAVSAKLKALNDLDSVHQVMTLCESTTTESREGGVPVPSIETNISFKQVSFGYSEDVPVLRDLSFTLPKGRITYLIGASGAGKSTLLDLLLRLTEPQCGQIITNGHDIRDFNLIEWRHRFGYVSQDAALFNATVRENLLLARPDATQDDVIEACRLSGADAFIQELPSGYETAVGDRGLSLSGGQRKRIAIARALLLNPDVLILDEATSAFEQSMERALLDGLLTGRPGLTILQITHRLQSVEGADSVLVLERGELVASGHWDDTQFHAERLLRNTEKSV